MRKRLENFADLFDFLISSTTKEIEEVGFSMSFKNGLFCLSYKDVFCAFKVDDDIEHVYVTLQNDARIQGIEINDNVDEEIIQTVLRRFNEIIVPIGELCLGGI
mgnify:CR=1 FL=1